MQLQPVGDCFLVEPDEAEKVSEGGIVIPDGAQEKPRTGVVLAVGDGLFNMLRGEYIKPRFERGQRVMYRPWAGIPVKIGSGASTAEAMMLKTEEIIAIIAD